MMATVTVADEPMEMTDKEAAEFADLVSKGFDELTAARMVTGDFVDLIEVEG